MTQETHRAVVGDLELQTTKRFDFDLANTLTREPDLMADLLERQRFFAFQAVAQTDDASIALVDVLEQLQDESELLAIRDRVFWLDIAVILEELMQLHTVTAPTGRRLARGLVGANRAANHDEFAQRNLEVISQLLHRRLATEHLFEPTRRFLAASDQIHHVGGNMYRLDRIDQRALDRLFDPPRGVG